MRLKCPYARSLFPVASCPRSMFRVASSSISINISIPALPRNFFEIFIYRWMSVLTCQHVFQLQLWLKNNLYADEIWITCVCCSECTENTRCQSSDSVIVCNLLIPTDVP